MKLQHCFKVLMILLQVYQSSSNDISDWLIRLGSAFDNSVIPPTNDRYLTGPETRQRNVRFQPQTKRQLFFPNYFVKEAIPIKRRTDHYKLDNVIKPFSIPRYSDIYQPQPYEGRQEIKYHSTDKIHNQFSQSPISLGLFYKTNDARVPVLQKNSRDGELLKTHNWRPKTNLPYDDGVVRVNTGRYDYGKIMVHSRPVLSQTTYILPARRYKNIRKTNMLSKAFTSDSNGNEKTPDFPKFMANYQTNKFDDFSKYEKPKENKKLYTWTSEKHIFSPYGKMSMTHSSTVSNSQDFRKMLSKMFNIYPSNHRRFKRSALNLEKTFSSRSNLPKLAKSGDNESQQKYPYYNYYKTGHLLKNSPIKYAESVENIPLKSEGGTEFYDSKKLRYCSEVESDVDAVPDRIKNKMPEDEDDDQEDEDEGEDRSRRAKRNFDENRGKPRLTGLGDKIDCFRDKYFGTNPLDNPFFYEDTIEPPEPIQTPFHMSSSLKKMSRKNYEDTNLYIPLKITTNTKLQAQKPVPPKAQSRLWVNPNKANNKNDYPLKKPNTNNNYHLNKPKFYANIAKEYPTSYGDNKANNIKAITNRNMISLPAVIFDKYTQSTDPQTRVYGDIIGNIQSNLKVNTNDKQTRAASAPRPIVRDLYKYKKPNLNNGNYQTYTRKENKHSLSQRVRTKRESELLLDLPLITAEGNGDITNVTDIVVSEPVTEVEQPSIATDKNIDLNDQSGVRKSSIGKSYSDVNRKSRQNYQNVRVGDILEAASFEREKTTQLRNHRRGQVATTTTKSTSPEGTVEQDVHGKDQSSNSKDSDTTQLAHNNDTTVIDLNENGSIHGSVNPSNFTGLVNTEYNSSSFHSPGLQNKNSRRSESIFDVSAYLPQPLYFEPQPPILAPTLPPPVPPTLPPVLQPSRHNISSKYNLHSLLIPKDSQTDDKLNTPRLEGKQEQITSSEQSSINPTVIIPRVLNDPVNSRNNFKDKVDGKEDIQPIRLLERVTKLNDKQFVTSTARTTTTLRYIPPVEDTTKYTEKPRRIKTNTRGRNSQRVRIRKPTVTTTSTTTVSTPPHRIKLYIDQEGEAYETTKNIYSNTDTIPTTVIVPTTTTTERHTTTYSRRGRRPQKPYQRQYNHEKIDSTYEHTPRKPKIVEKTSTKRKTTVITNSKRYENNGNAEPNYDAPIEKQSTIIYNQENTENLPEEPRESESVHHHRDTPSGPAEGAVFTQRDSTDKKPYRGRKRGETRRRPVKEESRYQEDVEEEEIIQERSTPYHGPALAKKINELSEIEEEQSYRNDGETEGFSPEIINNQEPEQEKNIQNSEQLNDSNDSEDPRVNLPVDDSYNTENINNRGTRAGGNVLEDGGMSARILDSFASLIAMESITEKPTYEKNPSERLYFYVDES